MNKLKFETPDLTAQNIEKLASLFPGCVTEGTDGHGGLKEVVNFDLLKQMLSDAVLEGDEAYEFTWICPQSSDSCTLSLVPPNGQITSAGS